MTERKQMTQEEYVSNGGLVCPYCWAGEEEEALHIDGSFDYEARCVEVHCENCGEEWWERYQLIGYEPKPNYLKGIKNEN